MKIHYLLNICFAFLLYIPVGQGQVKEKKNNPVSEHNHEHVQQDSSYHCGKCNHYLIDSHEATNLGNGELHYHGIGTADAHSVVQCSGCNAYLGTYDHTHDQYHIAKNNLSVDPSGTHQCAACNMPLFDKKDLAAADDLNFSFKKAINAERIRVVESSEFYDITGSRVTCQTCSANIGNVTLTDRGGLGIRLNLKNVKKKKKNKKY